MATSFRVHLFVNEIKGEKATQLREEIDRAEMRFPLSIVGQVLFFLFLLFVRTVIIGVCREAFVQAFV